MNQICNKFKQKLEYILRETRFTNKSNIIYQYKTWNHHYCVQIYQMSVITSKYYLLLKFINYYLYIL